MKSTAHNTPIPYVGYIRTSTDRQDYGLESQEDMLKSFVTRHEDELVGVYVETMSGKRKDRPELLKAIKHAKSIGGKLLIAKLDRLSRSLAQVATLMETKVDFVCVDNPHATSLTIHILAAIAEHERKTISQRIKDALVVVKRKRGHLGGPNITELSQKNKNEALTLTKEYYTILDDYRSQGHSYKKIAQVMNRKKLKGIKGGWSYSKVWRILNLYGKEVSK